MKRLKFSVYYRLCEREKFFDKFWSKESKKFSPEMVELLRLNLYETMEIIVTHVVNNNIQNLKLLLTRTNAKYAKVFFDYLMGTEIKYKNKNEVIYTIDKLFNDGDDNEVNK